MCLYSLVDLSEITKRVENVDGFTFLIVQINTDVFITFSKNTFLGDSLAKFMTFL